MPCVLFERQVRIVHTVPSVVLDGPSPEIVAAVREGWLQPGQRVLDLGCGLGSELAYLAHEGLRTYGIDVSAAALLDPPAHGDTVHLIQGDVLHLPFVDTSFDALLDRGCFHYLPPAARDVYVAEARRVLRPGGRALVLQPGGHQFESLVVRLETPAVR